MLSPAVLSHRTSPSIFMMLSWLVWSVEIVGLPSIVMWGDRGEFRCCGLSKVWNGRDGWNLSGDVVCHAGICWGPNHRSRHSRTIGATTCPVWNGLLTNYEWFGKCALLRWVGNWCSYSPRLTWCTRGRGTFIGIVTHPGLPWKTLALLWYCDYHS
jgi:hypothetical protein